MTTIEQWLRIDPFDTLFFKGAEPMIAGVSHEVRTVFPPMPATVLGSVRGAILCQRGIDPHGYMAGKAGEAMEKYPLLGAPDKPGFELAGPLFELELQGGKRQILFPAPAHWHADLARVGRDEKIQVHAACPMASAMEELGLTSSTAKPLYVFDPASDALSSLAGYWVNGAAFAAMSSGRADIRFGKTLGKSERETLGKGAVILPLTALYSVEERVGIALEPGLRRVRQGHLYGTTHVRLRAEVRLLAGITGRLVPESLDTEGVLQLGGEQRVVRYECLDAAAVAMPNAATGWALSLMPVAWQEFTNSHLADLPRASGPLIRMGGWDMKEHFHKPTTAFLPAGTSVFLSGGEVMPFGFINI